MKNNLLISSATGGQRTGRQEDVFFCYALINAQKWPFQNGLNRRSLYQHWQVALRPRVVRPGGSRQAQGREALNHFETAQDRTLLQGIK